MELHFKRFLLLFIPTFFLLGFYPGVYFYFNHQDDLYSWYSFNGGASSAAAIIFSGFMNFGLIFFSIILATLFSFLAGYYLNKQPVATGKRFLILNAIALTVFLSFLYMLYQLLALIGMGGESFNRKLYSIGLQTVGLAICYIAIALVISFFYFRVKNKATTNEVPEKIE